MVLFFYIDKKGVAELNKWRKVIIGGVLLAGFALYTQYEKSAEPVWKVNDKNFRVVGSLQEGMTKEYVNFEELEVVDRYGLLQQVNKTIPLKNELRTLRIEKIWNLQGRLYLLYSIDLKERDKSYQDIPTLTVKKVKLSNDQGKESMFSASINNKLNEGFVYKHRLYRSTFIVPQTNNVDEDTWRLLSTANRYELKEIELLNSHGIQNIQDLAFKVSAENIYEKVLESSPINKKFTYGNKKEAVLKSYGVMLYNHQLSIGLPEDDDLVGFTGWYKDKSYPFTGELYGTKEKGYSVIMNPPEGWIKNSKSKPFLTLKNSLHKDQKTYTWKIPKKDIMQINTHPDQPIVKNEVIHTDHNMEFVYEGLEKFDGKICIIISIMNNQENQEQVQLNAGSYFNSVSIPEEYARGYIKNVVTVTNNKKQAFHNYDLLNEETADKRRYYINFFLEDINKGPVNQTNIPEEDLSVSLSDLVYSNPLPKQVTVQFKVPKLKTN
jgi:hypothetical protein